MNLKEAIDLMRGEVGTSITLTIIRGTEDPLMSSSSEILLKWPQ